MNKIKYNPNLSKLDSSKYAIEDASKLDISVREVNALVKIIWNTKKKFEHVWLIMGKEYDFFPIKNGYEVTIDKKDYNPNLFKIATSNSK